ncbi:MAG TPA: endo-1,4-beta-xylanase, partial [Mobilitalea sp.]|nr:endo-1,4-beta-xylanase [Mobilitalea sp.]
DKNSALKDVFSDYFLMGAAINGSSIATAAINDEGMADILKKHFNSTTLSNLMKPSYLLDENASKASSDGMPVLKFDSIDPSLQFCKDNGIKMRGHTLVWHNQTPEWFFYKDYDTSKGLVDAATMELRLESYIKQVIQYCQDNYPGVIYCWDVVNEAISDNGTWRIADNYWYTIMKETYIEKAFYYARKYADKGVSLIYNDYNVFLSQKRLAIYMLASNLKQKGLIDGLGLQPTVGLNTPELDSDTPITSFKKTLEKYAELGLELQITELSFKIDGDESNRTPENLQKQADRYYEMMYLLLKEDSDNGGPCNITSVTVFGICDDYPLYNNYKQNLYLWDKDLNPKACFYSYLQAGLDWQANH